MPTHTPAHMIHAGVLTSRDDVQVLIELLLIAQVECLAHAQVLAARRAVSGSETLIALASRAYDLRLRFESAAMLMVE